jgi:sugar lactone lactonase YvrE
VGEVLVSDKDEGVVWKLTAAGVTNLAGIPGNPGGADGLGAQVRLALPRGIAVGPAGMVFFADAHRLRAIAPGGGLAPLPGGGNGAGEDRFFDLPSGLAADTNGNVYVADRYTIRKITPDGEVSVLAGTEGTAGHGNGLGTNAQFSDMEKGLALDGAGNLYVGDGFNDLIRKVTPHGTNWVVSTLAGQFGAGTFADGAGTHATFNKPCGVAVDRDGIVYVADSGNHVIRKITPEGMVSTLAGVAKQSGLADGPVTKALFNTPEGVAVDAAGNVWVVDTGNRRLRRITPEGQVVTIASSSPTPGPGEVAPVSKPPPPVTLPPTAQSCIRLARAGVGEGVILAFVRGQFAHEEHKEPPLTWEQILYLEDQGVPENVISVLTSEVAPRR